MRRSERGAALLIVIAVVALLAAIAVDMASRSHGDVMLSVRLSREAASRRLSDSGFEIARGILTEREAPAYDHYGQDWADPVPFTLSEQEKGTLRIADESGKILVGGGEDRPQEQDLPGMLDRLFAHLARSERGGHQRWNPIREKVFARLGLAVKKKVGAAPEPARALLTLDGLRETGLTREEIFGPEGLHRYLTCFGNGRINLNTAPRAVLLALDEGMDEEIAEKIVRYRGDFENGRPTGIPFKEVKDLKLVEGVVEWAKDEKARILRDLYSRISSKLSVSSDVFSARVEGSIDGKPRESWAFFKAGRTQRANGRLSRTLKRLAAEEIRP